MGKASQRKKARRQEKKIAETKAKTDKVKPKKAIKLKKAAKKQEKKSLKLKKGKATVLEIPHKKSEPEKTTSGRLANLKNYTTDHINRFKKGIDPKKADRLKKELRIISKKGFFYVTGIIAVIAMVLSIEMHSDNRVLPGTKAGNINLGYLTYDNAKEELVTGIHKYMQKPLIFKYGNETKEINPEDLNLRINIDQTMAQLPIIKFEETGPAQLLASLFYENNVIPNYIIDGDKTVKVLEQKFNLTDKRAKNAALALGEEGFTVQPEKKGIIINRKKLISDVRSNLDNISSDPIVIEILDEQPRVTAGQLTENKDRLIALLNTPITLLHDDESLKIKLLDHLDAVSFEEKTTLDLTGGRYRLPIILGDGQVSLNNEIPVKLTSSIQAEVDTEKIANYLQESLIQDIEIPTSPANIYTNEEGKVVIEGKGENGKSVSKEKLVAAIELAVNHNINEIQVPVHIEHAPVTISEDLQEKGINGLLATGHSAYYGSPANRMFNIKFGTDKYNGVLIEPGEEFSFNDFLGPVDYTSGFKSEKIIKKNKLEYEIGGGICQVSTTMYRAVLQAGLPIVERNPHSWKVSYYSQSMGNGLDATIYPGVSDLKFTNNTPGYLLIQAYTEGAEAYFKFYGTDDGRMVALDGPYGGGLTYRWNRTIALNGETHTEEIWSRYRPIPPPEPAEKPKPIAQTETDNGAVNFNF